MKTRISYILIISLVLGFLKSNAGNSDTLTLAEYLRLFNNTFTTDFNLGWFPDGNKNPLTLSFDKKTQLDALKIKLNNGLIISPEISGWAYSYRKLNEHLFWLIYYLESESGTSLNLCILDTENRTISKSYQLANAFGDQGDWAYKYGKFENDSTYHYLLVYGSMQGTQDSIFGQDRIKRNGEFLELQKRELKK